MSEDRITEKVYCYDHPSAYNNHDVLAIAAMANHRDNNECWPMMAMTNGGMNNWMNNPFAYIMFLALFRNGFGGWGGDGNGAGPATQGIETQKQTIQMVVDVTIEDGGFSRTYTMSDNISVTYANDLVLSTERDGVLREVEILKNQSSEELSKMDEYKKDVDECEKILAEWNPAFREKRETEERFSKIETSMADLKNMMAGLIKELKG